MKKLSWVAAAIMALLLNSAAFGGPCLTIGNVTTDGVATEVVLPVYLSDPQGVVAVEVAAVHSYPLILGAVVPGSALPATHATYSSQELYDGFSTSNLLLVEPTTHNEPLPAGEVLRLHVSDQYGSPVSTSRGYVSVWYTQMTDKYGRIVAEHCTAAELANKGGYIYSATDTTTDTDGDGVPDYLEITVYGTKPNTNDSDYDRMPDGYEIAHGLNPVVYDAQGDLDGDGVTNYNEFLNGTNPADNVLPPASKIGYVQPIDQMSLTGKSVVVQISALSTSGKALTYSAAGLPPGVNINSTNGLISGVISSSGAASFSPVVTITDGTTTVTASFSWIVLVAANVSPLVNAGVDQSVTANVSVTLNGAGSSDSDGSIVAYSWTQVSGSPTVAISNASSVSATFVAPSVTVATTLTFQLTVTDNGGVTGQDTIGILVAPVTGGGGITTTLTFSASPTEIVPGANSALTWTSAGATSCTASGGWSGVKTTSGSEIVSPTATTNYTLTCTGAGGSVSQSVTVVATTGDTVWVDDAVPAGASPDGIWNWVSTNPAPFSGALAHQTSCCQVFQQHYFSYATDTLAINAGDNLFTYVYLDPANPPTEIMLQWYDNTNGWEHRAYWGANTILWGFDGTNSRRYMGPLPATGQWVRLEVPANLLGLEGVTINGMAFAKQDGTVTWDRAGKNVP